MKAETRKEWNHLIREIEQGLEDFTTINREDILILGANAYINELEFKVANYYSKLDQFFAVTLSEETKTELITSQLMKEENE